MKRIRLDIRALTASPEDGGSFMFFLYREGMDKCLPVKLSPPDMHAVLSNFNRQDGHGETIHNLFHNTLQQFRIELLEVTVVRDDRNECFACELLLFDGEKEIRQQGGFIDGVILAKQFACPIYTDEQLMEKYASAIDLVSEKIVKKEIHLQKLKEELANAISSEDYERAAQISKAIDELSKED
ncbi:MAG: bifunctional nuclease family protein [Bacteroidales bacterium]|nr:bifunctional nuclease family protein [Bacteroidales bacterium]